MTELLRVENLSKTLHRGGVAVKAVDDVSFHLDAGETLALVGPSGSGKTTIARLLLRLIEPDSGRISFQGQDWLALTGSALRRARSNCQIVFQNPDAALNPRSTVLDLVGAPLKLRKTVSASALQSACLDLLQQVGLDGSLIDRRPHELSGGQKQRVAIARAIAAQPRLIVLDEATSALDATIRAGVLDLLADLQARLGLSYLMISHDLFVVRAVADRVIVLDSGRIVEQGAAREIIDAPQSLTARALVDAALPLPF